MKKHFSIRTDFIYDGTKAPSEIQKYICDNSHNPSMSTLIKVTKNKYGKSINVKTEETNTRFSNLYIKFDDHGKILVDNSVAKIDVTKYRHKKHSSKTTHNNELLHRREYDQYGDIIFEYDKLTDRNTLYEYIILPDGTRRVSRVLIYEDEGTKLILIKKYSYEVPRYIGNATRKLPSSQTIEVTNPKGDILSHIYYLYDGYSNCIYSNYDGEITRSAYNNDCNLIHKFVQYDKNLDYRTVKDDSLVEPFRTCDIDHTRETFFSYDEKNRISQILSKTIDLTNSTMIQKIETRTYSENDEIMRIETKCSDSDYVEYKVFGKYGCTESHTENEAIFYKYSDDGGISEQITVADDNVFIIKYDEFDNEISKSLYVKENNGSMTPLIDTTYQYNPYNNLLSAKQTIYKDGSPSESRIIKSRTYDGENRLICKENFYYDDEYSPFYSNLLMCGANLTDAGIDNLDDKINMEENSKWSMY